MVKFVEVNQTGLPVAFYSPDIHGDDIPSTAYEITDEQWYEFISNAGYRRWDGQNVVEYTPPSKPEPNPVPDEISRRQFFQQLAVMGIISKAEALSALQAGVIPPPLQIIIDQLPTDDDKFDAQMLVVGATTFNRLHPLSETVRIALSWTEQQKDDFWIAAYKL